MNVGVNMNTKEELVLLMVQKLKSCPNGTETTVCDLLNMVTGSENLGFNIDDFFELDEMFRKKALASGLILDSMKHDFNPGLPFDRSFVLRRI